LLDPPKCNESLTCGGFLSLKGVNGVPGSTHSTALQRPSSIAAAARHTIAAALAPPRSTISAKFTFTPRYSAIVDGAKDPDLPQMPGADSMPRD
jgi:hypothetical protein